MKSLSDQSVRIFATNVRLCCYFRNTSAHGLWFSEKGMLLTGGKLLHNGWKICELPSNYFSLTCQQNSFTEFEFCSMYTVQSSIIGCITHILIGNECFNPKYRDLTFWRRHMKYAVFKCSRIIIQLKSNLIWKRSNYASRLLLARIFLCCYVNHNFLCCYFCDQSACRLWFSETTNILYSTFKY